MRKGSKFRKSRGRSGKKGAIKSALLARSNKKYSDDDKENFHIDYNDKGLLGKLIEGHENTINSANIMKRNFSRGSGTFRRKVDRLEDELTNEKSKNAILQNDLMLLEERLGDEKKKYTLTLKKFHGELEKFKTLQTLVLDERNLSKNLTLEKQSLELELKAYMEFIISILGNICLLPDTIEVDANSKALLEFSFEKKSKASIPKDLFIQNKLISFIQSRHYRIESFNLVDSINNIMNEYNEKTEKENSKISKQESIIMEEFKNLSASLISNDSKVLNNSSILDSNSPNGNQNNSNYNININLVLSDTLNDSSGKKIQNSNSSKKNQGKQMAKPSFGYGNKEGNQVNRIVNFFHQELGLNNTQDSSIMGGVDTGGESFSKFSLDKSGSFSQLKFINSALDNEKEEKSPQKRDDVGSSEKDSTVEALYDFSAERENDLSFGKGDKITVLKKCESGWWIGYRQSDPSVTGYFPFNFVKEI